MPRDPRSVKLTVLPTQADLVVRTWLRLVQVHDRIGLRMNQVFHRHDLSSAQFDVLATLGHGDGITQQELARRLLVTKGNVCGLIDRMAEAGLVERRPDPEDRRANRIYLTTSGRTRLLETLPDQRTLIRETLGCLDASQLESLHDILGRLGPTDPDS